MQICHTTAELRQALHAERRQHRTIAVVPTMGNLHRGHMRLLEKARQVADTVVVTLFVNPMQFGHDEDLDKYPRTPDADIRKLTEAGCHYLFTPSVREMYPAGLNNHTVVNVPGISEGYCGATRPGHFDGVATVVSKLFNVVQADHAVFGLKDYQQFQVIRKMTQDLCFPIQLHGVPTERDEHGLALSSRNSYLSDSEKQLALEIGRTLRTTAKRIEEGNRDYSALEKQARDHYRNIGIKPDYFNICHARTLKPATPTDQRIVILAAAFVGRTRLIDNIELVIP